MFERNLVLGLWINEPVQKQVLISPLTGPKSTGNGRRKSVMKLGRMQQYTGPAERKFHTKAKPPSESNTRRFSKLYNEEISRAQKNNRDVNINLSVLPCGRPLFLGSLDQTVQRFLLSLQRTGGLFSSSVAISAAKALIA